MKTKKIIFLVVLIVLISSCDKEIGRCDFTEAQLQTVPYEHEQTIGFINSEGNVIDLVVTSKLTWNKVGGDGLFGGEYSMYRMNSVLLESEPDNIKIRLWNSAYNCLLGEDYSSLEIYITKFVGGRLEHEVYLDFDPDGNFLFFKDSPFYDSIEINGKVYFDVVEYSSNNTIYDGVGGKEEVFQLVFYNTTYGILQVKRDGENFLTINN